MPAEIAQAVKRIQFVTGRQVSDVMAGAYLSVFKGRGMEFDEVRPYVPGDDIRAIDWNVTARTGEPHVKRFVEERELTVMLLVDVSASQDFGSGRRSKLEAAVELSALLALIAVENGDKVGLLAVPRRRRPLHPAAQGRQARAARSCARCSRAAPERSTAPRRATALFELPRIVRRWWTKLQDDAHRAPSAAATSIAAALEFCRQVLPRRAVLFLISDFLDDGYLQVLRHANRKHDVVAALITDPREAEMPPAGLVTLEDAESGRTRLVDTRSQAFRDELARARGEARRTSCATSCARPAWISSCSTRRARWSIRCCKFFRERERRLRR